MSRMIVLGDSNIICMDKALRLRPAGDPVREGIQIDYVHNGALVLDFVLDLNNGARILNPMLTKALVHHGICHPYTGSPLDFDGDIVLKFGSGVANTLGLEISLGDYQFISEDASDSGGAKPVIPIDMILDVAVSLCKKFEHGLAILRDYWPDARLFVMAGPPPSANDSKARATMKLTASPEPSMRLAIYQQNVEALRRISSRVGASFIAAPAQSLDKKGFLAEQFNEDGFHGNAEYGELVFQVLQELRAMDRPRQQISESAN